MRRNFPLFLCAVIAVWICAGCTSYQFHDPGPARPFVRVSEPIDVFEYDQTPARFKLVPQDEETKDYKLYKVKFKIRDFESLKKDAIWVYWFQPKNVESPKPLLFVMPPTGGPYEISLYFGRYFAKRGFAVLCPRRREGFFKPNKDADYQEKLFRQAVIDIRRGIDWATKRPEVDADHIGILGVSLGAIFSQLAMQADERIGAGAFLLGGQDLPLIMETSQYTVVRRYRKGLKKLYNLDDEGLRELAYETFGVTDPKSYPGRIDPEKVLMVSGRYDAIIPYEVTKQTWENLGYPDLYVIPTGHYSSFLFRDASMRKIYRHIVDSLDVPDYNAKKKKGKSHGFQP